MKILDFILNNKEYLEDLITRSTIQGSDHIPPEPEKVPNLMMYYIYNYNHDEAEWLKTLSDVEEERMKKFGATI